MKKFLCLLCLLLIVPVYAYDLLEGYYEQAMEKCTDNACRKKVLKEAQAWAAQRTELEQSTKVIYVPTSYPKYNTIEPEIQKIKYGYNSMDDFVPTNIGEERIHYGYNAVGDYVPMSIGDRQIHYGYNAFGEFVPMGY